MKFQLSNIISELLEPNAEASKNCVKAQSSEDMLSSFDKLNAKLKAKLSQSGSQQSSQLQNLILLGADAVALFPILNKHISAKVVAEEILNCDIELDGISWREMCRYNALNMTDDEQKARYIKYFIPTRYTISGNVSSQLTIRSCQVMGPHEPSPTEWIYSVESPNKTEIKMLLSACTEIGQPLPNPSLWQGNH